MFKAHYLPEKSKPKYSSLPPKHPESFFLYPSFPTPEQVQVFKMFACFSPTILKELLAIECYSMPVLTLAPNIGASRV